MKEKMTLYERKASEDEISDALKLYTDILHFSQNHSDWVPSTGNLYHIFDSFEEK